MVVPAARYDACPNLLRTGSRHDTAFDMSTGQRPEVAPAMVRHLWDEAIQAPESRATIHERAQTLLDQVNSENPVVN